jgi:hypothetical protein
MAYSPPEPLRGVHSTEGFECGEDSLDIWIAKHARQLGEGFRDHR